MEPMSRSYVWIVEVYQTYTWRPTFGWKRTYKDALDQKRTQKNLNKNLYNENAKFRVRKYIAQ